VPLLREAIQSFRLGLKKKPYPVAAIDLLVLTNAPVPRIRVVPGWWAILPFAGFRLESVRASPKNE
jgi:hypothetical protein